jgi:hypothetical protein
MQDEVDAVELWFCTMAPGITCDDQQDPAAEREHMVDDPNAESPGRRVEAKESAAAIRSTFMCPRGSKGEREIFIG